MANNVLPAMAPHTLTDALRDAALRKVKAEEKRKREREDLLVMLAKRSLPAVGAMVGGPAGGAVAQGATSLAEQVFNSFGGDE